MQELGTEMQKRECTITSCEVCGEKTLKQPESIIQTCDECWEIFNTEMSQQEFDQIYKDIEINVKGLTYNDE